MLSHITIGTTDFERAYKFYDAITQLLALPLRMADMENQLAVWSQTDGSRPYLALCTPINDQPHHPGNGQMFAFTANDRATVHACHKTALLNGGLSEGAPGLRPHYHANYFGAYFRDPDGNKLCVACHNG